MLGILTILVTVLGAALGVLLISGQMSVVVTRGVSMNPVYFQGDLVVVAKEAAYSQGQIVAYKIAADNEVILHRIIGGDRNGFTIKGDNNQSTDPASPEADQIIGAALVHIPQGGMWLRSFTSPPMLGLITFALLASGGTAAAARHTHRKRRKMAMSRHLTGSEGPLRSVRALSPAQRAAAVLTVLAGLLGIVVAVPAFAGPLEEPAGRPSEMPAQMRFSYSATVPVSPAYDETTVSSPDTVFRKLTDTVNVHLAYAGPPGTVAVTAELSTAGGWHSTVLLAAGTRFAGDRYEATLPVDLDAIEARAQAAATVTGIPTGPVSVVVLASVTTEAGEDFKPALRFSLTPLQLTLNGTDKDLTVTGPAPEIESVTRTLGVRRMAHLSSRGTHHRRDYPCRRGPQRCPAVGQCTQEGVLG